MAAYKSVFSEPFSCRSPDQYSACIFLGLVCMILFFSHEYFLTASPAGAGKFFLIFEFAFFWSGKGADRDVRMLEEDEPVTLPPSPTTTTHSPRRVPMPAAPRISTCQPCPCHLPGSDVASSSREVLAAPAATPTADAPRVTPKGQRGPQGGCFKCGGPHYASQCKAGGGKRGGKGSGGKSHGKGNTKGYGGKGSGSCRKWEWNREDERREPPSKRGRGSHGGPTIQMFF